MAKLLGHEQIASMEIWTSFKKWLQPWGPSFYGDGLKMKCLLSIYKEPITYTLKTGFNGFNMSLIQQDHITEGYPGQREMLKC